MFCSTVIPTVGRPTLSRAVDSVLSQTFAAEGFEVIVVNDSGSCLPEADWQRSDKVQIVTTNKRERSVARNTGAALAKGRYLHFLDDDDWLLPNALQSLWTLAQISSADWLYGGSQLVDRRGKPIIELHHDMCGNCFVQTMAGEWIPLQSSFIRSDAFFAVGGFHPLLSGPEDVDLCRRIALVGELEETTVLVACIGMGRENSSTNYDRLPAYSRWAREGILDKPNVFERMLASANSAYWRGRIARAYLTSAIWNLQRTNLSTAISRATFAAASFVWAGPALISGSFWHAVLKAYKSPTFQRGFQKALGEVQLF